MSNEMSVIEALVINATGWRDSQKLQWDEAQAIIYAARSDINRRRAENEPTVKIEWTPARHA